MRNHSLTGFRRQFWGGFSPLFLVLFLCVHALWAPVYKKLPPRAPFVDWKTECLIDYRNPHAHMFYLHNLFGLSESLRTSDVVILGSSHPMLGLSAGQLSEILTARSGHPVRVFDLGVPWGEGFDFAEIVMDRLGMDRKVLVADLYGSTDLDAPRRRGRCSPLAQEAIDASQLVAYREFVTELGNYYWDMVADSVLPRISVDMKSHGSRSILSSLLVLRHLGGLCVRDRATGDFRYIWNPAGIMYGDPLGRDVHVEPRNDDEVILNQKDHGIQISWDFAEFCRSRQCAAFLTLVPYPGFLSDRAAEVAAENGLPYAPISPANLSYLDNTHLNSLGRATATRRLAESLIAAGVLHYLGDEGPKSRGK